MKARLVLLLAAVAALALTLAACGGGSGGSAGNEPAAVAPPDSPLFVEAAVRPEGQLKTNIETLAREVAGIDDLGGMIVGALEDEALDSDEPVDFAKDIEPWLGERLGMSFQGFDGEDFNGYGVAVQTTDADAAQSFIDKVSEGEEEAPEEASYEGYDFRIDSDGEAVGMIGELLVIAEDEASFKAAADAAGEDSLASAENFENATAALPSGSLADVYADVGAMIRQAGGKVDPQARQFLQSAGINPNQMTLTASLVPGADFVELDIASDLGGAEAPGADASQLLGSLPGDSVAAFASAEFGDQLKEGIDSLDASGIPGEVPPNQLKSTLSAVGIDLDRIVGSLEDAGVFLQGAREAKLGGALVLTTSGGEAKQTVAKIGSFLRVAELRGVTAIRGEAAGFSVRDPELGRKPLVVAAKGDRIAIAYGAKPAMQALGIAKATTLDENPNYEQAVAALGGTPISGFVDGAAAIRLVESLIPAEDAAEFRLVRPYLDKAEYLAVGSGSSDGLATAKLILGLGG